MKNDILLLCLLLFSMVLTNCANPGDEVELHCLDEDDDLNAQCGLIPVPSVDDEPIDFCVYIDSLIDDAESNQQMSNANNILMDDRGNVPIIGAPHGASDLGTSDIANKVGDNLNFSSLRYFRFRTLLGANVNRPTNQAQSVNQEQWDYDAASVYHCYRGHLLDMYVKSGDNFYVEVHGNDRQASAQRLEIVSSGAISHNEDAAIKSIFETEIDSVYGVNSPLQVITLAQDTTAVYYTASATRTCGLFCSLDKNEIPAIHIEIPAAYRGASANAPERAEIVELLSRAIERIDDEVF